MTAEQFLMNTNNISHGPEVENDSLPASPISVRKYRPATELVFVDNSDDPHGAASVPIYQTATFKQKSATQMGEYDYSRSGNPTRTHVALVCGVQVTRRLWTRQQEQGNLDNFMITEFQHSQAEIRVQHIPWKLAYPKSFPCRYVFLLRFQYADG
ncbi:hypothetical protein BC936DRAFT_137597 [Jimgerdemannia flammicorona]|uniref:Cystathionine gamma-synthase n=1 Tax=Jimgerdemannia flammicorona TaxID=994334 RepID=A0A433DJ46_9FUNG|nr:hypothetical protein BC936DRAFT_137597 [Jimgerdemannia flammicorona]